MRGWQIGFSLAVASCASAPGPDLDVATPARGAAGAQIVIDGIRLCGPQNDCQAAGGQLDVGLTSPVRALIIASTQEQVLFEVPAAAPVGPTSLVLTVDDTASNAVPFEVLASGSAS